MRHEFFTCDACDTRLATPEDATDTPGHHVGVLLGGSSVYWQICDDCMRKVSAALPPLARWIRQGRPTTRYVSGA